MSSRTTRNEYSWSSKSPSTKFDDWDLEREMDRSLRMDKMFGDDHKFKQVENSIIVDKDGIKKYRIKLDVSQYDPNDIQIETTGNIVEISAKNSNKLDSQKAVSKFRKRFTLPEGVDPDKVKPIYTKDSYLLIEAPIEGENEVISSEKTITSASPTRTETTKKKKVLEELENTIVVDGDGNNKMKITMDIGSFDPSSIEIDTRKHFIKIRAEQVEKIGNRSSTVEMSKRVNLPSGVDHDKITTSFTGDGILNIEAPIESSDNEKVSQSVNTSFDSFAKAPRAREIENTIKVDKDGNKNMIIRLEVGNCEKDEIQLKVVGTTLELKLKYITHDDRGKSTSEYKKRFGLPEGADCDRITSKLNDEGILTLEAPVRSNNKGSSFSIRTERY